MRVTGWRCTTCGAAVGIADPLVWRCPSASDGRHHVLAIECRSGPLLVAADESHPLLAFDAELAWSAFAEAHGLDVTMRTAMIRELDAAVARTDGTGFSATPCARSDALSEALGFSKAGGVWVKDETGQVAGSHKARHLVSILLHLLSAEQLGLAPWGRGADRPPLAIASCGNAALAAVTLAAATGWPIMVFVPPWADPSVLDRLAVLGAQVITCPRRNGAPPGDPCVHRFREAVRDGAVPFSVQGPENAWCLDAGRTLGWELVLAARRDGVELDRVFVQVGGGAFAACTAVAFAQAGCRARVHAVQAEGCAPLARAWDRAGALPGGRAAAGAHWAACMSPWEVEPRSAADGILDDETYDGVAIVEAMERSGGGPVVAPEAQILRAHRLVRDLTLVPASPTGTAGVAGLLTLLDGAGGIDPDERVAVVLSGRSRQDPSR